MIWGSPEDSQGPFEEFISNAEELFFGRNYLVVTPSAITEICQKSKSQMIHNPVRFFSRNEFDDKKYRDSEFIHPNF